MRYFFIFLFFLLNISFAQAQKGRVLGKITDGSSPIPSVNIVIIDTELGTAADENGVYEIRNIPVGEYEIRFSAVGFESKTFDIKIESNRTLELNVLLNEDIIEVGVVEVTESKNDQTDTRTSVLDLNPRDAKIIPGAAEDVLRTLQALPGVLAPNDFSSQLIVRGSGPDQNLIIMDDVEIFNPYRLYGVISMFNPEAVSEINLITGGFPAKYGDRLSAVLDVTNREGTSKENLKGSLNASIVDANLVLEGKNPFNLKGSWLLNSRRTYYDLIIEPFVKSAGLVDDNTTFPNFYDVQAKFVVGPYKGHKFLLNGIYSRDGVDVVSGNERSTADSISVFNATRNDVLSFAWHYSPSTSFLNKLIFSWYRNNGTTDFDSRILDPSLNRANFEDVIPDTLSPYLLNIRFNALFSNTKYSIDDKYTLLWNNHLLEAGAGVDFMTTTINFDFEFDPQLEAIFARRSQSRAVLKDLKDVKEYNRYRAYLQNKFALSERFYLQPSMRFDYYDILDKAYFAPRISLSYALDDITTLRAVWGLYYQSPGYEKLRDQNVLYDLSDTYTKELNAEKSIHYVVGIERWLTNEWSIRFESYYKDFSDLILQKTISGSKFYTEAIPGQDLRYRSGWTRPVSISSDSITQIPVNGSVGEAYGLEALLLKKNIFNENRFSGWISYALAYAKMIEKGEKIPFRFDQRHTVNIVLNYQLNKWLDMGIRWQYGSGFPYSEPGGIKPRITLVDNDLDGIPETPEIVTRENKSDPEQQEIVYDIDYDNSRLNARRPPYHRLDVRFTAYTNFWNLDWTFYLDVINAYNRKNIIAYDYHVTPELTLGRRANTMFPIIPTLGFSIRF